MPTCRSGPTRTTACRKAFGENLARFYFDRYGIESVCLRIGSSFPEPRDVRMLTTWLSYDDLTELVRCALTAPGVGFTIAYGVSANRDSWWDNRKAAHLGWTAARLGRALPREARVAAGRPRPTTRWSRTRAGPS